MTVITVRDIAIKGILATLVVIGLGYISSAATQFHCEDEQALLLWNGPLEKKLFYVNQNDISSRIIFSRVGAKFLTYSWGLSPNKKWKDFVISTQKPVPEIDLGGKSASVGQARIYFPFLVSVDYQGSYHSLDGEDATSTFFCLCGLAIKVKSVSHWVS